MTFTIQCITCNKEFTYTGRLPKCCSTTPYYDYFIPTVSLETIQGEAGAPWVTLGLFKTPTVVLHHVSRLVDIPEVYAKCEHFNPTGSFKDRESEVAINVAKLLGKKEVSVISSGNAALSAAAYALKADIACHCFIPKKTSKEKIRLIKKFNGVIHFIDGFFEDVYRKVVDDQHAPFHVSAGQNPFRELGDESICPEIVHDIGFVDAIVVPMGNGSLLSGIFNGMQKMKESGALKSYPKLIGIQVKNAAPIAMALKNDTDYEILDDIEDSIAEGIVALESYCSPKAINALKKTNGTVIEVTDSEIKTWNAIALKKEALCIEPTAASVFPALEKCRDLNLKKVALIITGTGLKSF
ncbi:pyridoxal-phosphate dependent enzyme [Patescibacteria group bacterium]|nr:pyridoxal-phosphate dependent enzyme [Patescibacteria group bacterium]